jgi:hypothetical protein
MATRHYVVIIAALAAGAFCTEVADQWGHSGPWAELWFFSFAPAVLDVFHPSMAWVAASAVYALQCLSVYGSAIVLDSWSVQLWQISSGSLKRQRIS